MRLVNKEQETGVKRRKTDKNREKVGTGGERERRRTVINLPPTFLDQPRDGFSTCKNSTKVILFLEPCGFILVLRQVFGFCSSPSTLSVFNY